MTEISELQKKRAENLIWSCARDYSFTPDFKAYDSSGYADLYWNCIIGAVRRHYDYPLIESVFRSFQAEEESDTYEGLLWLGLENCVYAKEAPERPVLSRLRNAYANAYIRQYRSLPAVDRDLLTSLSLGHWMHVIGEDPELDAGTEKLLNDLEFSPVLTTEELVSKAKALYLQWFQLIAEEKKTSKHRLLLPVFPLRHRKNPQSRFRKFGIGFADHPDNIYGGRVAGQAIENEIRTSLSAEQLREFIAGKYGRSLFSPHRTGELEKELCSGNHQLCHLHFTYGERASATSIQNAFEALSRQQEAAQVEHNRAFYEQHQLRNRIEISRLSGSIRNSMLMYLQPSPVRSNTGVLNGRLVWRSAVLEDENIFIKNENGDTGDISVDILLDASTSQKNRQETISTQGYIIAESLSRCSIPCRVMSFCSMTGYTILRIFRDYNKPRDNEKIFEFVSNGCNRDGLAIRAVHHLMDQSPYEHRLLILLSDAKPNDVVKIHPQSGGEPVPYEGSSGIQDTAFEVRRARADGIAVMCIFTGDEEDLPTARLIYDNSFIRIRSFDRLAEAVGTLIRNQIRNM